MSGWTGQLLRVNLTTGECQSEEIPRAWLEEYVGGRGLADRYLYEELDPTVDPLSPDNKLIFATGPLTGTPAPCGARYMVVTKGPLTGAITTSMKISVRASARATSTGTLIATIPPKALIGSHSNARR